MRIEENHTTTAWIFAENIKRLRARHDLTQKQFADLIGVTHSAVSRYENVSSFAFPHADHIDNIARHFQIRIADLFTPGGSAMATIKNEATLEDALYILNRHLDSAGLKLIKYFKAD